MKKIEDDLNKMEKQAGAELCQAQIKLGWLKLRFSSI
jgi:hypothetical protein